MLKRVIFLVFSLLFLALPVQAKERITNYHARIEVLPKGQIDVVETIDVIAEHDEIHHGIYRDFPVVYKGNNVLARKIPFKVLSVRRDGQDEPFRLEDIMGGVTRIYAGHPNGSVSKGKHRYQFHYITDDLIGYFDDHDEIYWNVTGNGWRFPIDSASAEVILPKGADVLQSSAYTGYGGEAGVDYISEQTDQGMFFSTTRPMDTGEGLTIAVAFTKGVLPAPAPQRFRLLDLVGVLGVLVTFLVYYLVWDKVGRDPDLGVIVPEYAPPKGLSPASARYLAGMGWDDKVFAIGVVSLAVKGWLDIKLKKALFSKKYNLIGRKSDTPLEPDEEKLASHVAREGETLLITQKNWKAIEAAQMDYQKAIKKIVDGKYLTPNLKWNIPGVLAVLAFIAAIVFQGRVSSLFCLQMVGLFIPFGMVSLFILLYMGLVVSLIQARRKPDWGTILVGIGLVCAVVFLFGADFSERDILLANMDPLILLEFVSFMGLVIMTGVFGHLLKAPTELGQEIRRHLLGYKLYLEMAEQERLEFAHPPKMTPERFEEGLPWAMALYVENKWAAQFEKECDIMDESTHHGYHPHWYAGVGGGFVFSDMMSRLSTDLSSSLSSSSERPGKSVGGGGGGGGGGGW